jgi:hypothetical protein
MHNHFVNVRTKFETPDMACVEQEDEVVIEQDTILDQNILDPDFLHINLRLHFSRSIDFWNCSGYNKCCLLPLVHSSCKV